MGHLFQGRLKAILVEREAHLLEVCRSVVFNQDRAQMVDHPEDWTLNNYRTTAGLEPCAPFLDIAWTWEQLAVRPTTAQRQNQVFVAQGIGYDSPWEHLGGQVYLGDKTFVIKHQPSKRVEEIARQQTTKFAPSCRRFGLGLISRRRPSPRLTGLVGVACRKSPTMWACIIPRSVAEYDKWKESPLDCKT